MPTYQRLGEVPRKRHIQFRDNGTLLTEEVMGLEGFSGNESILYHLLSPCRVRELGSFEPIEREEWVPDAHAHRHLRTDGHRAGGRRDLRPQAPDVERRRRDLALPADRARWTSSTATARATRSSSSTRASGTLETIFGDLPYREGDYIVVPRGTTYRFVPEGAAAPPRLRVTGPDRDPAPLPERVRAAARARALLPPRHPPADRAAHASRPGRARGQGARKDGYQTYLLDYHPFDVVGWDGYVYPWTFTIHDFEPITGRIHMPPPSHQTFPAGTS